MKKIVFFSTPAYGHVLSVLPLIKGLTDGGHHVICHGTRQFAPYFEKCNVEFREYSVPMEDVVLSAVTSDFYNLLEALAKLNRDAYLAYDAYIRDTDVDLIIYDSMCSFAKSLAYKYQIKCVCLATTMAYNLPVFLCSNMFFNSIPMLTKNAFKILNIIKEEKTFRKAHQLPGFSLMDMFINLGDETLVFTPKEFQPFSNTFSKHVHFVGTTIKDRVTLLQEENVYAEYDYYVSLGSIFTDNISECTALFNSTVMRDKKILAVTGSCPQVLNAENITQASRVNQIDVLSHCGAFINHGGLNSVYESIYFGVPQLCVPQQEEQRMTALIAKKKRVAHYAKELNQQSLQDFEKKKDTFEIEKWQSIFRGYDGTALSLEIINAMMEA